MNANRLIPVRDRAADPGECRTCDREYWPDPKRVTSMPSHEASSRCESGKRSHCTCDTCY